MAVNLSYRRNPVRDAGRKKSGRAKTWERIRLYRPFYLMALPIFAYFLIFHYVPMAGIALAFTKYTPYSGPDFVGLANFRELFSNPLFMRAFGNTLFLSIANHLLGMFFSIGFALLLNEIYFRYLKGFVQTVLYIPHFISWVVTASIFTLILSPSNGMVNQIIAACGGKPVYFLISEKWWTPIFLFISRWKDTGWGTIIYLAALSGINSELYEAAAIDGAGRLSQTWHVTLPGIMNTILVVFILSFASVLNVFQPVFVLQNPMVVDVSEVIETYVYKVGLLKSDYGYSTAVGLFKSVITMALILSTNAATRKIKGEGIL